ncbi:lipocalin-like domain-containing protein [Streptomyces parvus]|uniref:lipocalin-like domain-containing protein n=1 Tax=Streptomyces parvus TaxID=66428 RepID=UPI0037164940
MTGPTRPDDRGRSQARVVGTWRLLSFRTLTEEGALLPGPLGASPTGLLFYGSEGHMAVHMMPAAGPPEHLSYAGTWRLEDDHMVHTLTVAARRDWLGTKQVRRVEHHGDRLTLTGTALSTREQRVLVWERVPGPTR